MANYGLRKSDAVEAIQSMQVDDTATGAASPDSIARDYGNTFVIGEPVFIRTVTHHFTGKIERYSHCGPITFIHLSEAAWVANDGIFHEAIEEGKLKDVSPVSGTIRLSVATIMDVHTWNHPLPRPGRKR